MEMKGNTLAIAVLVAGLITGAGAGYMLKPDTDDYSVPVQYQEPAPASTIISGLMVSGCAIGLYFNRLEIIKNRKAISRIS